MRDASFIKDVKGIGEDVKAGKGSRVFLSMLVGATTMAGVMAALSSGNDGTRLHKHTTHAEQSHKPTTEEIAMANKRVLRELHELGYSVAGFQHFAGLPETGELNWETRHDVDIVYAKDGPATDGEITRDAVEEANHE